MRARIATACAILLTFSVRSNVAAQPAPEVTGVSRVTGHVVTPHAELVAEAVVTLSGGPDGAIYRETRSETGGAFSFDKLPAGQYRLSARKPGYTPREVVTPPRFREGVDITISAAEGTSNVELTMRRAASIAGRILQSDATPAPGVRVMAALRDGRRRVMLFETGTISEWDGRYQIEGLPPGDFQIVVIPAAADTPQPSNAQSLDVRPLPLKFEPTVYPGVPESEPGDLLTVYEGVATEGIDVWLTPAPERFSVSGRIFWPEDETVGNLVIAYGGPPTARGGIWTVDDPGGVFMISGVSPGPLVLLARGDTPRGPLIGMAATNAVLEPVDEVRVVLHRPGSVAGRVIFERPLPSGAAPRVALVHALLKVSSLYPAEDALVGADGSFLIPQAFGTYRLDVRDLPSGWKVHQVRRGSRRLESLQVGAAEHVTSIQIVVGPSAS